MDALGLREVANFPHQLGLDAIRWLDEQEESVVGTRANLDGKTSTGVGQ